VRYLAEPGSELIKSDQHDCFVPITKQAGSPLPVQEEP
jgi:hypothetical protein